MTHQEPAQLVFKVALTGNQILTTAVTIDKDADFLLSALYGVSDANYTMQMFTNANRAVHSQAAQATNAIGTAQFPVPVFPTLRYPAGGRIGLILTNLSGSTNNVELVFSGVKEFLV